MNEETTSHEPQATDPAAGTGAFFTPPAAIDAIMGNPPLGDLPPGADGVELGDSKREERHMSSCDAALILAVLAAGRKRTVEEVTALEMGARRLCTRWFQRQRAWARRRTAAAASAKHEEEAK